MWIFIVAIIATVIICKTKSKSSEIVDHVASHGGMREKYSIIVDRLLLSHPNMAIITETRTFMDIGMNNPDGSSHFYFQQVSKNGIMIQYELKGDPSASDFKINWTFDDSFDQEIMLLQISADIQRKMMTF
ncbi:MAG: hypothetical protein KBT40_07805 [bacterium]|nr:hypothetical protein [Candidatus Minthenecus merdequi]